MENNNEEQIEELKNEVKKQNKVILVFGVLGLVLFVLVVAFGIAIFVSKSYDGSKTGHTESPFSTNNKDTSNINTTDDSANDVGEDSEIAEVKRMIAYFQPKASYMYGENMIESKIERLNYVSTYLDVLGISQKAESETNPSVSVELEVFKNTYFSIFGNNYIFDLKDFDSVYGSSWVYLCNDGKNLCWPNFDKSFNNDTEKFSVTIDYNDSNIKSGTYSNTLGESGTFEFTYTEGKYLKSVVLTKTN